MTRVPRLLLVDDSEADLYLLEAALEQHGEVLDIALAHDGEEAMAVLQGAVGGGRLPDLLVLDLNMPRMGGFDVLSAVRADPALRALRVIIFTTSTAKGDELRAYELGADAFMTKPMQLGDFMALAPQLATYWQPRAVQG
ncbi:response regulator [uncultured Deinococcus sp.]|nr:response regulator [uncultured Deinococcus sp.]